MNLTNMNYESDIQPYNLNCENYGNMVQCLFEDTKECLSIKETLLDIINKKEETIIINNEEYKNKEIDELISNIKQVFSKDKFHKLQDELNKIEDDLNLLIIKSKKDVQKIDNFIEFMNNISYSEIDDPEKELLTKNINNISNKILKNNNLLDLRNKYIQKRKELNSYIYFIQVLNQWNVSNLCPVCITNPVKKYIDPCGHTFCENCLQNNPNNKCMLCRKECIKIQSLFFI